MELSKNFSVYSVPFSMLPFGASVAIYGNGKVGHKYVRTIRETERVKLVAILDTDAAEDNYDGIPIYKPCMAKEIGADYFLIAAETRKNAIDMKAALLRAGIEARAIYWGGIHDNISASTEYIKFLDRFLQSHSKRCFIFYLPEHGNMGDYAIGYATEKFLREYFPQHIVIGVTSLEWIYGREYLMNVIRPDDVIFFNGGGYFGDLRGDDRTYRDMVESFPKQRKIFLPNTLTYASTPGKDNERFLADMKWLNEQSNLTMMLRDQSSYELVHAYEKRSYHFPDMAFYLKFQQKNPSDGKVLLCFRDDCEKVFTRENEIKENLTRNGISYDEFDIYRKRYVSQEEGRVLLEETIARLQSYECVLTDRLHGMILSVISGVPCLAFDNFTQKISGVYGWIQGKGFAEIESDKDVSDIVTKIRRMVELRKKTGEYDPPKDKFEELAKTLKNLMYE